jgi:hypothetical protein
MSFKGIPSFSPSILDTSIMLINESRNNLIDQLMDEGVAVIYP